VVVRRVKLSNNGRTDLFYSFGNEFALIAEQHRVARSR
jgi:hypothetical protein